MRTVFKTPDNKELNADWQTVSGRINFLLDFAGNYAPVNSGRAREVAQEFGWGKSTAQMIIAPSSNYLPKRDNLRVLVERCLLKINQSYPLDSVVMWVEHSAAPNPFTGAPGKVDHRMLAKVYLAVDELAKKMGVDVDNDLTAVELDSVYTEIFRNQKEGGIDSILIQNVLEKILTPESVLS